MQQVQNIENFKAITGCSDSQKAEYYLQMAGDNLESAVALFMDLEPQQLQQQSSFQSEPIERADSGQQQQFVQEYNTSVFNSVNPVPGLVRQQSTPNAQLVNEYRHFLEEKQAKDDGFVKKVVTGTFNLLKGMFNRPPDYGSEFLQFLTQQKIKCDIQFNLGNFQTNLDNAREQMKPLFVYVHDPQAMDFMTNKGLVTQINKCYHCLGLLRNAPSLEQLPTDIGVNHIVIYRIDLFDKVVVMEQFDLRQHQDYDQLALKLKQLKGLYNKTYIHEEQVKREAKNINRPQYMPNPFQQQQAVSPPRPDQQKLNHERELRRQQDQAFKQVEEQTLKKQQEELLKQQELQKQEALIKQQQEEKEFKKAQILSNLPDEPADGIQILFRFPSGETRTRTFNPSNTVETLFNFVLCQPDDCFNDPSLEFDLIQNFPRLSLKDKNEVLLSEVFVESVHEQLIVQEL